MESLSKSSILELNKDTVSFLRKQYDLDDPNRLENSIDHLVEWLGKQNHFMKKDFSREYLERAIILSKGSLEKTKMKLDKLCTYRTLLPSYFVTTESEIEKALDEIKVFVLPKLTKDHYRIFIFKVESQYFENGFMGFYKYITRVCEYIQAKDYCNGAIAVFDYSRANLLEIVKTLNLVEFQQVYTLLIDGYGMRLKGLYFITTSKSIDTLIAIVKQVISAKLSRRIGVFKDIKGLYDVIPKELLPVDYGGKERPVKELTNYLRKELFSKEFENYFNEMKEARTDEASRCAEKFNDQYMGMPGSFRKLNVD